jgi:hypothetical protein
MTPATPPTPQPPEPVQPESPPTPDVPDRPDTPQPPRPEPLEPLELDTPPAPDVGDPNVQIADPPQPENPQVAAEQGNGDTATPEPAAPSSPAQHPVLQEVEQRILPMFSQPVEDQPLDEMQAAYEELNVDNLPGDDQAIVRVRLLAIERNRAVAETLEQVRQARSEIDSQPQVQVPEARDPGPLTYDAVGNLMASSVYDGQNLPRLFRIVDPSSQRTVAYIEPGGPLEPQRMLGQLVGVVGAREFDAALRLPVIRAERIVVLTAASP